VGPVGSARQRCNLYVYPWQNDGHCKFQLNHCVLEQNDTLACIALADEHSLACAEHYDACGQDVQCVCPADGKAAPVPDEPGTIHVTATSIGQTVRGSSHNCEARVSRLPGDAEGPSPAPCIFSIHDCSHGRCIDRFEMLSCPLRATICERPVKCDCPPAAR
jgi:hypothetical protein